MRHALRGQRVNLAVGLAGLALLVYYIGLYLRVVTGPGDDNAIGLLFLLAIPVATLPSWGLVRWVRRSSFRSLLSYAWLVTSVTATALLAAFGSVFI